MYFIYILASEGQQALNQNTATSPTTAESPIFQEKEKTECNLLDDSFMRAMMIMFVGIGLYHTLPYAWAYYYRDVPAGY